MNLSDKLNKGGALLIVILFCVIIYRPIAVENLGFVIPLMSFLCGKIFFEKTETIEEEFERYKRGKKK